MVVPMRDQLQADYVYFGTCTKTPPGTTQVKIAQLRQNGFAGQAQQLAQGLLVREFNYGNFALAYSVRLGDETLTMTLGGADALRSQTQKILSAAKAKQHQPSEQSSSHLRPAISGKPPTELLDSDCDSESSSSNENAESVIDGNITLYLL